MAMNAGVIDINPDHSIEKMGEVAKKGDGWFKDETLKLESLVSSGDEDAKKKLLQLAQRYKVPVTEQMNIHEIKNRLKAKLRELR